jgi:hypothetical protein
VPDHKQGDTLRLNFYHSYVVLSAALACRCLGKRQPFGCVFALLDTLRALKGQIKIAGFACFSLKGHFGHF